MLTFPTSTKKNRRLHEARVIQIKREHATAARAIGCRRIDGGVSKLYVELVGAGEFQHAFAKVSEQRGLLSFCYLAQRIAFVS
jgi:hypothetical protein